MALADDLTTILADAVAGGDAVGFRAGKVAVWDPVTGQNSVVINGTAVTDVPFLSTVEALSIQVGDVVGVLRVDRQYFVIGRIQVTPGAIEVLGADGQVQVQITRTADGGGQIITRHPSGDASMILGLIDFGGVSSYGMLLQGNDGRDVMAYGYRPSTDAWQFDIRDDHENWVLRTDGGGYGLDRPYLEVPMYVLNGLGTIRHTTTAFAGIWLGRLLITHPAVHVGIRAWTSTGMAGSARLLIDGVTLGSSVTIPDTGGIAAFYDFGVRLLPEAIREAPGTWVPIEIQARLTTAPGASDHVTVIPYGVTKKGTP